MSIPRPWYTGEKTKPLAQVEFSADGATHKIELGRQPSLGYVIKVDGKIHSTFSSSGIGFKKRFDVFNGYCTISGFNLGGIYNRYAIEVKQPTQIDTR